MIKKEKKRRKPRETVGGPEQERDLVFSDYTVAVLAKHFEKKK